MSTYAHRGKLAGALLGIGAILALAPAVASANINVTTTTDEFAPGVGDTGCSLREAVKASNTSAAFGGCPAGVLNTPDTIVLTSGQTYGLTIPDTTDEGSDAAGDLDLGGFEDVTITTSGAGRATIDANGDGVGDPVATHDRAIEVGSFDLGHTGAVTLDKLVITDGDTTVNADGGGGLVLRGNEGPLSITNSRITANKGPVAAAMRLSFGAVQITDSTIDGNTATSAGGLWLEAGSLTMTSSTVSGNVANGTSAFEGFTGGLFIGGGVGVTGATLKNTTVSGNSANGDGGGIATSGALTLANVTVANNTADADAGGAVTGDGGGVFVNGGAGGSVTARNSLIADNTDASTTGTTDHEDCSAASGFTTQGYNLVEVKTGCTFTNATGDQANVPVGLNPLADNGGPTMTQSFAAGSPPDNAGRPGTSDGTGTQCEPSDQRGLPRDNSVSSCDIGAYEHQPPVLDPIGDKSVVAGQTLSFTATATADDPGDALEFTPTNLPPGASLSAGGAFSWTPTAAQVGTHPGFTISVADGSLGDNEVITITVDPDGDGDGVADASDNCPTQAGPASNGGCPLPVGNPPSTSPSAPPTSTATPTRKKCKKKHRAAAAKKCKKRKK